MSASSGSAALRAPRALNWLLWPFEARYLPFTVSTMLTCLSAAYLFGPEEVRLWSSTWDGSGAAAIETGRPTPATAYPTVSWLLPVSTILLIIFGPLTLLGLRDLLQRRHSILRNYPIIAHMRFIFEAIRPEMRQYFFEDDKDGRPFSRDKRALIYQRAKKVLDKRPFGTVYDVYEPSFEWMTHSMAPRPVGDAALRVTIGGPDCAQRYRSSLLNVSGMSFGAISPNAIRALNKGAAAGGFAQVTGEGGVSRYHLQHGGDLIWQIGSGYFGARTVDGRLDDVKFAEVAGRDAIKMIELKLSQGAKPGHGGVLPRAKITREIARVRGVPRSADCVSPAYHPEFATPLELLKFVARLRELAKGKPIGLKLCVGHDWEFLALCKAMRDTGTTPDYIMIDGKEGGTGAAPLEFADHIGMPLRDGLNFVHNALVGVGLRDRIALGASGKIGSAFDMARSLALGADFCHAARGFMFALGCIQAQSCHTDRCPTGVATTNPQRQRALVVSDKAQRVLQFQRSTVEALRDMVAAAGLDSPQDLRRRHFRQRVTANSQRSFEELYPHLGVGELLMGSSHPVYAEAWAKAQAHSFAPASA